MLRENAPNTMPTSEQQIQDKLGAIAQKLSAIEQRAESDTASKRTLGLLEDCRRLVGDLERVFTSLRDADRRHAAHRQEVEVAARRADLLLELSPMAYVLVHANGVILDANVAAARLLNLSLRHLRGKPFDLFLHGDRETFLTRLREMREGSEHGALARDAAAARALHEGDHGRRGLRNGRAPGAGAAAGGRRGGGGRARRRRSALFVYGSCSHPLSTA